MAPARTSPPADDVVGRENELDCVRGFLAEAAAGPLALVLEGEAGIGKSTLWRAALEGARERSYRVLSCRAVGAEVQLSFAALGDLLAGVLDEALPELPVPQRRALEVALLLEEARGPPPDQRAVGYALLGLLGLLARSGPVLVAIDDSQWLDVPTAALLEFALRRLESEPVGLLATFRRVEEGPPALELERAFRKERFRRLEVGPLSVGAMQRLLRVRLATTLARPTLLRLHETSGGNPFYALELARALAKLDSEPEPGRPLPIPANLNELVQARLAELPAGVEDVLLVVAALASPTVALVRASVGGRGRPAAALKAAEAAGVIELDGERIRFGHPLLGSTLYSRADPARRNRLHRRLSRIELDPEERARHLALGEPSPDEEVARTLAAAAQHASARGATPAAAELAELAIAFTPGDAEDDRHERIIKATEYHFAAGALVRAHDILDALLEELPAGDRRADVLLRLAATSEELETAAELCERALPEAAGDDRLMSRIHAGLGACWPVRGGSRHALAHARSALEHAELAGDRRLTVAAVSRLALVEIWGAGPATPGLLERALELEQTTDELAGYGNPRLTLAVRLFYQGRLGEARVLLEEILDDAAARGDELTAVEARFRLADVELRAGAWASAAEHVARVQETAEEVGLAHLGPGSLYRKALVDAHLGRVDQARAAGEQAAALSESVQHVSVRGMIVGVFGFLELSIGNASLADRHLRPVIDWLVEQELALAPYPTSPYALEALIDVGELDRSRELVAQFEREGRELDSPWVFAVGQRLRSGLEASAGDLAGAIVSLEQALAAHEGRDWPFERGLTLLALGQTLRRAKQKRAAREPLQASLAVFEGLGSPLWAEKVRQDLQRLGGRPRGPGQLTPTEERVAALVLEGCTNREVAAALFVTERTVEGHLTRIYAKLDVRSRGQLARRLAGKP